MCARIWIGSTLCEIWFSCGFFLFLFYSPERFNSFAIVSQSRAMSTKLPVNSWLLFVEVTAIDVKTWFSTAKISEPLSSFDHIVVCTHMKFLFDKHTHQMFDRNVWTWQLERSIFRNQMTFDKMKSDNITHCFVFYIHTQSADCTLNI